MTTCIPTIDFTPFMSSTGVVMNEPPTPSQRHTAAAINAAFTDHGFLQLSNLGISSADLQAYFSMAAAIFSLPQSEKLSKLLPLDAELNVGYAAGVETLNTERAPDIKETYNIRNTRLFQHDFSAFAAHVEPTCRHLWQKLDTISQRFALACALACDLPTDFFSRCMNRYDSSVLRLNFYPPCEYRPGFSTGHDSSAPLRVSEHTDYGMFTILFNDAPGLQVKAVEGGEYGRAGSDDGGGWLEVPVPDVGTAIVNTGALMARWTNDKWRATAHRVVVSNEEQARQRRFSIACFCDPDRDFIVDVHPSFVEEGKGKKYASIRARDYINERLQDALDGGKNMPTDG
eukprot:GFKZ01006138.1.p1 GENE.GFKZ01006138.1~~GFKZ01006138.1.p1  ORF type:complete len:344 (+),score=32.42 GFKZ01006138.1:261-1292(+)